jgi:hypothetical protein
MIMRRGLGHQILLEVLVEKQLYSFRSGTYTKIGRQVTVIVFIEIATKGSVVGAFSINWLPFTASDTVRHTGEVVVRSIWKFAITVSYRVEH